MSTFTAQANTTENSAFGSFINYKKVVMTLVNDLERLKEFSQNLELQKTVQLINTVLQKIKNESFSIAIVGEFKRGKSTFINALLGQDILPSDVLPCSAALNRVTFGLQPSVTVILKDGTEETIEIDQLTDYVTKLTNESEKKAASVKEAIIYYNVDYCRNNVDILDTPGLNDDNNMTEVTLSVLPEVDAAIMIISAQSPFSQSEKDFLENKLLSNDLGRVIFIVNGIDHLRSDQVQRVINHVEKQIKTYILERAKEQYGEDSPEYDKFVRKIGKPKVFGISAYQALQGKESHNQELLNSSNFREFEQALEQFLTEDRAAILLQVPVNRITNSAQELISKINIQENALKMSQEKFQKSYDHSVAEIQEIRRRKKAEMALIDKAADNVKYRVQPLIYQLPIILKQATETAIDATPIEQGEVKRPKVLQDKFARTVTNAVQKATRQFSEKIQGEIQQGIDREVERLQDFTTSIDEAFNKIEMQFVDIQSDTQKKTTTRGEAITAALSVFTGFGGIWSGYRIAGIKGSLVGAGASVATFFGAGMLAGLLGLATFGLPLLIATGVVSIFAGDWLAKLVFTKEMERNFKTNFQEAIIKEIDKQLQEKHIEQEISNLISDPFIMLKRTLSQEIESLLDDTEHKLTQLRGERERGLVLNETEQKKLELMRTETEKILGNGERLSQQIKEIMNI